MVALSKPTLIQQLFVNTLTTQIPVIDLSKADSKQVIVKACEDFGFFKVVNHGIPLKLIDKLESEAAKFFDSPESVKAQAGPPDPFGYGNKNIGRNGDVGWLEYLLLDVKRHSTHPQNLNFQCVVDDYVRAVKKMACEILEMMADELKIEARNVFSKLLMDEESDSVFRVNYYPPCPEVKENGGNLIGFGEHTDPQIISVLRSDNTSGLQISLKDSSWLSVPPDSQSFFINVGDSLQVMTNGRFKSIKHRVVANSAKSRMSMIYFGGPPLKEKIAPLASLLERDNQHSLYNEFTWFDYKNSAFNSTLSHNRTNLTASGPRPNPQGSYHYGQINITRTIKITGSAAIIDRKQRYHVNGVSFTAADTPLKLADYFNISGVFKVGSIPDEPTNNAPYLNTSVMGADFRAFIEIVFENKENIIQSWHLDGYNFFVVGMDEGRWSETSRNTYNLVDAVSRCTVQVYPKSWTAIYLGLDNVGMWNIRNEFWVRQYLGEQFYLRVYSPVMSSRDEYPLPQNALLCGRAVGKSS